MFFKQPISLGFFSTKPHMSIEKLVHVASTSC
jgi:hypothetical protein